MLNTLPKVFLLMGTTFVGSLVMPSLGPQALSLLRLLPALNSTVILMFAYDEYTFLEPWMNPAYRPEANALLPRYFGTWLKPSRGLGVILTTFPLCLSVSLGNLFVNRSTLQNSGAEKWYWLGLGFQMAHFVYAKPILKLLSDIPAGRDLQGKEGNVTASMKEWLRIHLWRTLTTDVPAMLCFVVAKITSEGV